MTGRIKRTPVLALEACRPTIRRESGFWCRRFRNALTQDDLEQEGWLIAEKVLRYYDGRNGAQVGTLLTLALRRHYRRLIKTTLLKALCYTEEQQERVTAHVAQHATTNPMPQIMARLMIDKIDRLPYQHRALVDALLRNDGEIAGVAREQQWSIWCTRQRVLALRTLLTKGE